MRTAHPGERVGHRAISEMELGSSMKVCVTVGHAHGRNSVDGVGGEIAMGEHRALRQAGRSARVENRG